MPYTDGSWDQGTPVSDLQHFVSAAQFLDSSGLSTVTNPGMGLISRNVPPGDACTFFANLAPFTRTGVYATPALSQEQFGTAAAQPGPSTVSGTSGPLALYHGFPPTLGGQMATTFGSLNQSTPGGILTGPAAKGFMPTSFDVIYTVTSVAASVATCALYLTHFVSGAAATVTTLVTLAANGLATATNTGLQYVINVPLTGAALAFITSGDTELIANVNFTAGASTGTVQFYGIVVHYTYNLN